MTNRSSCAVCSNPVLSKSREPHGVELCARCNVILRRLSDRLVPLYDIEPDRIRLETSWSKDLRTDSLDMAELIVILEEEFGNRITETEAQNMETVADLVLLLARHSHS